MHLLNSAKQKIASFTLVLILALILLSAYHPIKAHALFQPGNNDSPATNIQTPQKDSEMPVGTTENSNSNQKNVSEPQDVSIRNNNEPVDNSASNPGKNLWPIFAAMIIVIVSLIVVLAMRKFKPKRK